MSSVTAAGYGGADAWHSVAALEKDESSHSQFVCRNLARFILLPALPQQLHVLMAVPVLCWHSPG